MTEYTFSLKDLIKDNRVWIDHYRKGFLYYKIYNEETQTMYEFPVDLSDAGDATFPEHDKAILFMRYINKAMKEGTLVKQNSGYVKV